MNDYEAYKLRVYIVTLATIVLIALGSVSAVGAADAPTAIPPHESPKSPSGNGGATMVIATVALVLVAIGILAGDKIENRHTATPSPQAQMQDDIGPHDPPQQP